MTMAGNTKLMGFTPDGKVQLERWGTKITIFVSPDSLDSIRRACYTELPKKPSQKERDGFDECSIHYDEYVGRVHMVLDIESAAGLADALDRGCSPLGSDDVHEKVSNWASRLRSSVKTHHDYHNTEGEPGVADET